MHPDLAQMLAADRDLNRKANDSRPKAAHHNQTERRSRLVTALHAARSAVRWAFAPRQAEPTASFELR